MGITSERNFWPPAPLHWKNRSSKSREIDFFEKKFEKILKVQKFLWSRSGRNFCLQGRIPKFRNFRVFNPGTILRKPSKLWSSEAFEQKPHFSTNWWLLTLTEIAVESWKDGENIVHLGMLPLVRCLLKLPKQRGGCLAWYVVIEDFFIFFIFRDFIDFFIMAKSRKMKKI